MTILLLLEVKNIESYKFQKVLNKAIITWFRG